MTPPGQKVATIANAWRAWSNINGTRRRRYLVPAFFMAKTAARIFDVPGLKQSGDVVIGFIEAFKAPKQNRMKAREQMDHIDQAIASVQAEVCATTQGDEESHKIYLYQAQQYVDTLERLKKKLAQEINKRSRARFADQWNIVETLETHEKQFLGARLEFLEARLKVYSSSVQSHQQPQTSALTLTGQPGIAGFIGRAYYRARPTGRLILMDPSGRRQSATALLMVLGAFF